MDIKKAVLHSLHLIAPEVDLEAINPDALLREEIELDSVDFLRFVQQLHNELNVDVLEKDYDKLSTLNRCVAYLEEKIHLNH